MIEDPRDTMSPASTKVVLRPKKKQLELPAIEQSEALSHTENNIDIKSPLELGKIAVS